MSKEVTCIKKRGNHYDAPERIYAIGGTNWSMSEDDAIKAIETKTESFYVSVNKLTVAIIVAMHKGRKYLKTTADDYKPDNLLSLPECP